MKISLRLSLCAVFLSGPGAPAQEPETKGLGASVLPKVLPTVKKDATTDAELKAILDKGKFGGTAPEELFRDPWSLEKTSQFIKYGEHTTLVPKGAILHVPEKLKASIVTSVEGNLIPWIEFLGLYRGIITFLDVDLDQASGVKPLDPARLKAARETGMIVVALYQRHPISVAPAVPKS